VPDGSYEPTTAKHFKGILPPNIICKRSKLLGLIPPFTGFQNSHRRPNTFFEFSKEQDLCLKNMTSFQRRTDVSPGATIYQRSCANKCSVAYCCFGGNEPFKYL